MTATDPGLPVTEPGMYVREIPKTIREKINTMKTCCATEAFELKHLRLSQMKLPHIMHY